MYDFPFRSFLETLVDFRKFSYSYYYFPIKLLLSLSIATL